MKIIDNNKINLSVLKNTIQQPYIFEKGTDKFWEDEYVSEQMLNFHLNPDIEAASKTKETIDAETSFIIKSTDMKEGKDVLDLGCGPGLYVKEFAKTGATITGIDISERSINYANENIKTEYEKTFFIRKNYLDINFEKSFDIVTLIFYDFCALSTNEQELLLSKIHRALRDNGIFILDVVTEKKETSILTNVSVSEGGFWSPKPYIEILNTYLYEEPKTEGLQYTIIDEEGITKVIRIYHRLFSLTEITEMLTKNGFKIEKVYKNLKGESLTEHSDTFGIIVRKV
ncbi:MULTISPECIES: class I SAM-dependent methyltransferase [unclassified Sedimentibacter]|uniref:class I SAM-dependent methyltransferase n=1 Tax=unclassified Sedimentibacter TaxID=2649220 RepID=UPI0027E0CED0|nr:class I SAM-dependent methyltransferase [Sedimentibacter sp. MB35-C1]WMJ77111.1 class I SAM-dependent methyltransferase [Sedimentibacter sp. MB35-C1]